MKLSYRQFADHLKQRARLQQRRLRDPEDDWASEAHFVLPDGALRTVPIDPGYFQNRLSKRQMVEAVLVPAIHAGGVRMFGYQGVFYMLSRDNPAARAILDRREYDPAGVPDFATVPGHVESLVVGVWDAERAELWVARITRPASGPPTLGAWRAADVDSIWGPMFDPIAAALR